MVGDQDQGHCTWKKTNIGHDQDASNTQQCRKKTWKNWRNGRNGKTGIKGNQEGLVES